MTYLIDDVWLIVKEFMLDWRRSWHKNMNTVWEDGIKCCYPTRLVGERYDIKTKLYYTTFRSDYNILGGLELRVSNTYSASANQWLESFYQGKFLTLS
jgi:hypothetical protein